MSDFHFLRPEYLFLFIPFLSLMLLFFYKKKRENSWEKFCSKDLLPYVIASKERSHRWFYAVPLIGLSLLITGMAGPTWEETELPAFKRKSGLVIVMDLSDTMNADDIKPSRLKRAIYKVNDFLNLRKDGQTALIVFSQHPFVVTPLTDDTATILAQIPVLEANIMPTKGHNVSKAVQKALDLLSQAGESEGSILLITSDLKKTDLEKTLEIVSGRRVKFAILGCGTENQTPVLNHRGSILKDKDGSLIMTTLPVDNLKKLSKKTNGVYCLMSHDDSDIKLITKELSDNLQNIAHEDSLSTVKKWQDQGVLSVLLAIPFMSLLFRRGVLALLFLLLPLNMQAKPWSDYFQTSDAKAEALFKEENYSEAKELFTNPEWKACTHYHLREYAEAAALFSNDQSVKGLYNYGTTKAKSGDFEEALKAYGKVLDMEPDHEDALYNKKIIEEQQKNEQQDKQNEDKQNKEKNKDQSGKQEEFDQEKTDQENDKEQQDRQDREEESLNEHDNQKNETQDMNASQDRSEDEEKSDSKPDIKNSADQNKVDNSDCEDEKKADGEDEKSDAEDMQRKIDDKWLLRIKDDPGGLLRRKFQQQYYRQKQ
jgi:Ca-activated chloride channel family protein